MTCKQCGGWGTINVQLPAEDSGSVDLTYQRVPCPECSPIPGLEAKIESALSLAFDYGSIDGAHHKTWVIDQMVRALTGDSYEAWVREVQAGEDGPETYGWEEGIPP